MPGLIKKARRGEQAEDRKPLVVLVSAGTLPHPLIGRRLRIGEDCPVWNFRWFLPVLPQLCQFTPFRDQEWDFSGHLQALDFTFQNQFVKNLNFPLGLSFAAKSRMQLPAMAPALRGLQGWPKDVSVTPCPPVIGNAHVRGCVQPTPCPGPVKRWHL